MDDDRDFDTLNEYLRRVPGIDGPISNGRSGDGNWWTKFAIDIRHPLAWNVVQEFGCVLNYQSLLEYIIR